MKTLKNLNSLIPRVPTGRQMEALATKKKKKKGLFPITDSGKAATSQVIYIPELPVLGGCFWKYLTTPPHEGNEVYQHH